MSRLKKGDKAPDFSLLDQHENRISLGDFRGKKLLVYFYPKASTPGCTQQACSVRDSMIELRAKGVAVVGVSPDQSAKQKRFDDKYDLGFPLLCDTDFKVAEAYGAFGEKKIFGKTSLGIMRTSILVDEEGRVIEAWYKVKPADTVPNALAAIEAT